MYSYLGTKSQGQSPSPPSSLIFNINKRNGMGTRLSNYFTPYLQMHTVMIIEKSIADVSSKHPKATNPRISSICEKLSPTSLAVGRIVVGELDCTGNIDASLLMVVVVGTFCEGSTTEYTVRPLTVVTLGAIS